MEILREIEETEENKKIKLKVETVLQHAKEFVVETEIQYNDAADFKKEIKKVQKEIDSYFAPSIETQMDALKEVRGLKKKQSDPLDAAGKIIGQKMTAFYLEQRRIADQKRAEREAVAVEEGTMPAVEEAAPVKAQGISYYDKYYFDVVDPKKLKAAYKIPDLKTIQSLVDSMHEKEEDLVGGIKVWKKTIQRTRA